FEPLLDEWFGRKIGQQCEQIVVIDVVEGAFQIGIHHPLAATLRRREVKDRLNGIMSTPSGSEPVATRLKSRFPLWLQGVFDPCLQGAVGNGSDPQGSQFAVLLRDKHTFDRTSPPGLRVV